MGSSLSFKSQSNKIQSLMATFRWFTLRLFWSALLLPPIAFFLLWILHEIFFKDTYFPDVFLVIVAALLLFPLVSFALTHLGRRRFDFLRDRGRSLLLTERDDSVSEILPLLRRLFDSGLLAPRDQEKCQQELRRGYFPFYVEHLEHEQAREQVRAALREGVRAEEAYQALKSYVLSQPQLTLGVADIAEELLDYKPEDQSLVNFFVQHFLENRSTHYRAEYFYANHLSHKGNLSEAILDLCLERILGRERKDDFAAWCCVRAFQSKWAEDPRVRRAIFHFNEDFGLAQREDDLARTVAVCAAMLDAQEISHWRALGKPVPQVTLKQRAQKWHVIAHEWALQAASWLRRQRALALAGAGALALLLLYLNWPAGSQEETPAPKPVVEPEQYFSLQVSSVKERSRADRMVRNLKSSGLEVRLVEPQTPSGWYAIRVGRYPSQEKAQAAGDSLKTNGVIREFLVRSEERQ